MFYPIGWHKVLKLDTQCNRETSNILSLKANHERELIFILTTRSLHVWCPRPAVEIVCHRRSQESIESIGFNRTAIWKTDSSVIVVATDRDQLLFYRLSRRISPSSASNFILPGSSSDDRIYNLHHDSKTIKNFLDRDLCRGLSSSSLTEDTIPALTLFSFGKLDLSSIGISCLMSAEEEIIVGARNGDIYGIHWNGNIDNQFPWSLAKDVKKGSDFVVDLKFSSILSGFAIIFYSGRVGFMPTKSSSHDDDNHIVQNGTSPNKTTPTATTTHRQSKSINYSNEISGAVCAEINHKFRLVAIGLNCSKVVICNIDDSNSTLVINHKLELQSSRFPHDTTKLGKISSLRYSPDSFALLTSWEGGGFAIWSVFGSLLFCTQQWQLESQVSKIHKPMVINSATWGREGYSLWFCTTKYELGDDGDASLAETSSIASSNINGTISSKPLWGDLPSFTLKEEVVVISLARSTLPSSPHLTCSSDAIVLMGEDRLYIGPSVPQGDKFDHWFIVDIPQAYLNINWPIRYAIVDRECKNVAIAGNYGFSIYSLETSKWTSFNKKSSEKNFSVCGDIIWWKDYLLLTCYNIENESFELRAYIIDGHMLDDEHSVIQTTKMEITRFSIFENRLLVSYVDGTMGMFMLNLRAKPNLKIKSRLRSNSNVSNGFVPTTQGDRQQQPSPRTSRSDSIKSFNNLSPTKRKSPIFDVCLQIAPIENLVISNLQANAYCILSIALTRLHFKNNRFDDSILLNACGKLFLLEREAPPNLTTTPSPTSNLSSDMNDLSIDSHKSHELDIIKVQSAKRMSNSIHFASASLKNATNELSALSNVTFKAVSVIATNVEQFWISPEISNASEMSYFKKSLWLSCGGSTNNLQVWLPLLNDKHDPPTDLYVPDRIMLPIKCDIYPLAIRSSAPDVTEPDDAIVLGAESDILYRDNSLFTHIPYSTVKRQCRVYLHRILRELLLNQHLGYYARKIAESCQCLPYFAHCFELLLHEVLEEEATSPVPLPDPMLPQVVRFIKEFPVYLETVVHCARKSELSMWSHLFDERAVGNPRYLFQECLEKHKLDTAASCLIILQNLDRNIVSQRMVKELIKAAKDNPKYEYLIQDLENFLKRAELDCISVSGSGSPNSL